MSRKNAVCGILFNCASFTSNPCRYSTKLIMTRSRIRKTHNRQFLCAVIFYAIARAQRHGHPQVGRSSTSVARIWTFPANDHEFGLHKASLVVFCEVLVSSKRDARSSCQIRLTLSGSNYPNLGSIACELTSDIRKLHALDLGEELQYLKFSRCWL